MGEGGFEPPKAVLADLQSVPFGLSGIPPNLFSSLPLLLRVKADNRTRTDNLLITNQLLCQLSHIGITNKAIKLNGAYRARTCDPLLVRQMLSQLS